MSKRAITEVEQAESQRSQVMTKLKKVADLVAKSPSLGGPLLERLDLLLITFLEAHEAQRSSEREARWAAFEASQSRNALRTVHELGLPPRFLGAFLVRKYPSYPSRGGLPDTTMPGYHRPHVLAGDITQFNREEILRLMGQGSAGTMKAAEAALDRYGLRLGISLPGWIDFEQRSEF